MKKKDITLKFARLREGLPVFNEITDYADHVDDAVREVYHRERAALLRKWHGAPPDERIQTRRFTYRNGDYTGEGLVFLPSDAGESLPALVFVHGGGWNSLCKECYVYECAALAGKGRCVVFSIDYRLAPEYKFPVYLEDCYAGLLAAVRLAPEYGADPGRLVVAGDSAGGNIAAALCLMARDRPDGPEIKKQILLYPVTGPYLMETADMNVPTFLSSRQEIELPYVSPIRGDLKVMPPTLMVEGTCDFLLEDNLAFAQALREAGVEARLALYSGMPHGFIQLVNEEAADAMETVCDFIKEDFA